MAELPKPRITFNYLGQFDGSFVAEDAPRSETNPDAFLTPAPESVGESQGLDAPLSNWLSVSGQVYGGELSLGWTFSREMFEAGTIQDLADAYVEELKALIAHCGEEHNRG